MLWDQNTSGMDLINFNLKLTVTLNFTGSDSSESRLGLGLGLGARAEPESGLTTYYYHHHRALVAQRTISPFHYLVSSKSTCSLAHLEFNLTLSILQVLPTSS